MKIVGIAILACVVVFASWRLVGFEQTVLWFIAVWFYRWWSEEPK